jgi:hypothetical protein
MRLQRKRWTTGSGWVTEIDRFESGDRADLVFVFGATALLKSGDFLREVCGFYPGAYVCGCSTAGEIAGCHVLDDAASVTAVKFNTSKIRAAAFDVTDASESFSVGCRLAEALPHDGLVHTFVLSDGLSVNGSELVKGIASRLPPGVTVTGGLSGDGARFAETYVCADGASGQKRVVILGFYGDRLRVGFGSMGGWDSFGPERLITRSKGNVLFELDGRSALDLYKEYLGAHAAGLPASGLLFPLTLRTDTASEESVVRTILAVNEEDQSMTFAGDVPEGALARLMRANFDRLIDGAAGAASACRQRIAVQDNAELAILISCVGRKLVLKQRVEEEVESVQEVLGANAVISGFYSYGEISPFTSDARCTLHNQTMTITTFTEV